MKIRSLVLLLLFAVLVLIYGCKSKKQNETKSEEEPGVKQKAVVEEAVIEEPAEHKQEQLPSKVVVLVNNTKITKEQLQRRIEESIDKVRAQMPEPFRERYLSELRKKILNEMIMEILLDEQVKANEIEVSDEEIERHIELMNEKQGMKMTDFLELLEAKGQSLEDYKQKLRKDLAYEKLMVSKFNHMLNVTEEDARKYYLENPNRFQQDREVVSFEQVKDSIIQELTRAKQSRFAKGYIEELKQEAKIVFPVSYNNSL